MKVNLGNSLEYSILIEPSGNNGYIVSGGYLESLVFENINNLMSALQDILEHPKEYEKLCGELFEDDYGKLKRRTR